MIDIVLVLMILILSIKGYFNGFMREMVGFVGLIGGIFVAARAADPVSKIIDNLLHMDNMALVKLIAFLLVLALIWGGSSFVATVFIALRAKPHTAASRSLGMGVAIVKYFLIFSIIIASLFNNPLIRDNFENTISSSRLFPRFNKVGSVLTNITVSPNTKIADKKASSS